MAPIGRTRWLGALLGAAVLAACGGDSTGPPPAPLVITTETLPNALVDAPYTAGLNANGGRLDYEWTVISGQLPPGLTFSLEDLPDGDDIVISGTPDQVGNYTFTIQVTSDDGQTDTHQFNIQVLPPAALAIDNYVLPPALVGGPYDVRLRASGGETFDYSWSIASGALPPGLSFDPAGQIVGTPTATDTALITLRVDAGDESVTKQFELRVVANRTATYDITPVPVVNVPGEIRPHVEAAIALWEDVLAGDLTPIVISATFFGPQGCAGFGESVNGTTVEDILLLINISEIDGPGDVLGQAGPCAIRQGSASLPVVGILTLDSDDLLPLVGSNTLTYILAHEIGHVLGFGTLWDDTLLLGEGGADPRFAGPIAVAEWQALGGAGDVPVENQGGDGTADSHWRESVFGNELMTGFSEQLGVAQPLSRVSIAAMEDLGYQVDYSAADPYSLSLALRAPGAGLHGNLGYDIVLDEEIRVLDDSSTPIELKTRTGGTP